MDKQEKWRLVGLILLFIVWLGIAWFMDSSVNSKKSYADPDKIVPSPAVVKLQQEQEFKRLQREQWFQESLDRRVDEILAEESPAEQLRRQNRILSDILLEMRYQELNRQFERMDTYDQWTKRQTQTQLVSVLDQE